MFNEIGTMSMVANGLLEEKPTNASLLYVAHPYSKQFALKRVLTNTLTTELN